MLYSSDKLDSIVKDFEDLDRLNTVIDIVSLATKMPPAFIRIIKRIAKLGQEATIWPLKGGTGKPGQIPCGTRNYSNMNYLP